MELRKVLPCNPQRGFTLIELVLVLGLVALLSSLTIGIELPHYLHATRRTDAATIRMVLLRARAQAMNQPCSTPTCEHGSLVGVHIRTDSVTLFMGDSYLSRLTSSDTFFPLSPNSVEATGDVLFSAREARALSTSTLTITDATHKSETIRVNENGSITYEY